MEHTIIFKNKFSLRQFNRKKIKKGEKPLNPQNLTQKLYDLLNKNLQGVEIFLFIPRQKSF